MFSEGVGDQEKHCGFRIFFEREVNVSEIILNK